MNGLIISIFPDEAFQNLHHLSTLNLAYNQINQLDFGAFDSVGTLSHLNIDLVIVLYFLLLKPPFYLELLKIVTFNHEMTVSWYESR